MPDPSVGLTRVPVSSTRLPPYFAAAAFGSALNSLTRSAAVTVNSGLAVAAGVVLAAPPPAAGGCAAGLSPHPESVTAVAPASSLVSRMGTPNQERKARERDRPTHSRPRATL